jgi:hypothetical protein
VRREARTPTQGDLVRRLLAISTLVLAATAVVAVSAALASRSGMPDRYRYTGWMSPVLNGSSPKHVAFEGDGVVLVFSDSYNLTDTPVSYTVCVRAAVSGRTKFCRGGVAPTNTKNSIVRPPYFCCGDFVAIWSVGGREAARWSFRFNPESEG